MNTANKKKAEYTALAKAGKFCGTVQDAIRKRKMRSLNKPMPYTSRTMELMAQRAQPVIVPLGDYGWEELEAKRCADRRMLWSDVRPGLSSGVQTTGANSDWKKRSTFRRYLVIESWAFVRRDWIEYHLGGQTIRITAPRGYRWSRDANGLMLIGRAGEYHPTADDLLAGAKAVVARLKERAATRRQAAKKAQQQLRMVKRAEKEGARICLADSLRAGNCRAGSTNWAQRHNLDPLQHYRPTQVLALANGDASRVAIVAAAAIRRHQHEMERGYCLLSEHYA